jgi:hypothetical protein
VAEYKTTKHFAGLIELLNLDSKADVERHCRDLVVHGDDFAGLVLTAQMGDVGEYRYASHFDERIPDQLNPSAAQREAAGRAKVGPLEGDAKKFFSKIDQIFKQRRLFAAHLLYMPSHEYWHLFYFDQRDRADEANHWREGPHIHYANDRFHRDPLTHIWARVRSGETAFLKPVHIRYIDENRDV